MSATQRRVASAVRLIIGGADAADASYAGQSLFNILSSILREVEDWSENFEGEMKQAWSERLAEAQKQFDNPH